MRRTSWRVESEGGRTTFSGKGIECAARKKGGVVGGTEFMWADIVWLGKQKGGVPANQRRRKRAWHVERLPLPSDGAPVNHYSSLRRHHPHLGLCHTLSSLPNGRHPPWPPLHSSSLCAAAATTAQSPAQSFSWASARIPVQGRSRSSAHRTRPDKGENSTATTCPSVTSFYSNPDITLRFRTYVTFSISTCKKARYSAVVIYAKQVALVLV